MLQQYVQEWLTFSAKREKIWTAQMKSQMTADVVTQKGLHRIYKTKKFTYINSVPYNGYT